MSDYIPQNRVRRQRHEAESRRSQSNNLPHSQSLAYSMGSPMVASSNQQWNIPMSTALGAPATSVSADPRYQQYAMQHQSLYDYSSTGYPPQYANTLPPPQHATYGRGISNPQAYHLGRQPYASHQEQSVPYPQQYSPLMSPDMNSSGWSHSMMQARYPDNYTHENQGTSASDSSDRDISPPTNDDGSLSRSHPTHRFSIATTGSKKEKIHMCFRVVQDTLTGEDKTCGSAFARKADLQRHLDCVHDEAKLKRIDCTKKKCDRKGENGFKRRDHLTEHLRNYHQMDIPKKLRKGRQAQADEDSDEDEEDAQEDDTIKLERYTEEMGYYGQS